MKINLLFKWMFLLTAGACFFACKKDDTPPSHPLQPVTFSAAIAGKWKISEQGVVGRISQSNISSKVQDRPQFISIEFFKDSSYIVSLDNNTILTGKYNISDSTIINIYGIGDFKDIKIEGGQMNFKLSTESGFIVITANKAAEIAASEETSRICRNWKLLPGTGGRASYIFSSGESHRTDLRFSTSGTYLLTVYNNIDSLAYIRTGEWKWHPGQANAYQYSWGHGPLMDNRPVTITELTENSLKMEETYYDYQSYYYETDGVLHGEGDSTLTTRTYSFIPSEF